MTDSPEDWTKRLSTQQNVTDGLQPYLPFPVERIPSYTRLPDFEKLYVRKIVTVGRIIEEGPDECVLLSVAPGESTRIPLSFENFPQSAMWPRNEERGLRRKLWVNGGVYKVWATVNEGEPVLCALHLKPVEDKHSALEVLSAQFKLNRYRIDLYSSPAEGQSKYSQAFTHEWLMAKQQKEREKTEKQETT